jgi:hypothetical protein
MRDLVAPVASQGGRSTTSGGGFIAVAARQSERGIRS